MLKFLSGLNTKAVGASGLAALAAALFGNEQIRTAIGAAFTQPNAPNVLTAVGVVAGAAAVYYGRPHTV